MGDNKGIPQIILVINNNVGNISYNNLFSEKIISQKKVTPPSYFIIYE